MVIYTAEKDLRWFQIPEKGIEVALLAHRECYDGTDKPREYVYLAKAFELCEKFGAIPASHDTMFDLPLKYPELFKDMMSVAGENHSWISSTLVMYTGLSRKILRPKRMRHEPCPEFGFGYMYEHLERSGIVSVDTIVTPGEKEGEFRRYDPIFKRYRVNNIEDILEPFTFIKVPEQHMGKVMMAEYGQYLPRWNGPQCNLEVDWEKVKIVTDDTAGPFKLNKISGTTAKLDLTHFNPHRIENSWPSGCYLDNPDLTTLTPGEAYEGCLKKVHPSYVIALRKSGGVIMQRPLG